MDVGISPGGRTSVTGFPPAIIVNGAIYVANDITSLGVMLISLPKVQFFRHLPQ